MAKKKIISYIEPMNNLFEKKEYTEEQKKFIEYKVKNGNSIILSATAGSGKTFSCEQRLKYLISNGIEPSKIIFFSFTKAAVDELRKRIGRDDVYITTIHAYTTSVLAKAGKFKSIVTFYDFINWYKEKYKPNTNNHEVLHEYHEIIGDLIEESEKYSSHISAFKMQKEDGISVRVPDFYKEYCEFLKEKRARDFSDMLLEVRDLFKEEKWLNMFKNKYDYIFVDEYQDTSTIQLEILLALNAKYYYLIGDKFQSIYGYSGSSCSLIENMLKNRRETEIMTLTSNFRSDIEIVMNSNKYSDLKAIPTKKEKGSVDKKLILTIDELRDILDQKNEVAILTRTNKVIKKLELRFLHERYPMRYFNFITEKDCKDFVKGEISTVLKKRLDKLKGMHDLEGKFVFESDNDIFSFIGANKNCNKFITSIHKSKGREFDVCVVVNSISPEIISENGFDNYLSKKQREKISFTYEEEDQEEKNIHYVAVSRSKHKLYYMIYDA